ncbi:MAG: type I 3-dehydroquinate dehydratase [Oscillospiraceae bacterium]
MRGLPLGEGPPKLCLPLVARTEEELLSFAQEACTLRPDLIEWRIDAYESAASMPAALAALALLRRTLGALPLLCTCRCRAEGGLQALPEAYRLSLLEAMLETGEVDLVDLELSAGSAALGRISAAAHRADAALIGSAHDFEQTPPVDAMLATLRAQQHAGADIAKLAVMPRTLDDITALLDASRRFSAEAAIPLIAVSMGRLGLPSRLCGSLFSSAVLFGAGSRASAPGQVPIGLLREILRLAE